MVLGFNKKKANTSAALAPKATRFEVGDRVDAKYKGGNWYPGRISHVNADGTYNISYDDGDVEQNLESARVKAPMGVECTPRFMKKIDGGNASGWAGLVTLANSPGNHMVMIQEHAILAFLEKYLSKEDCRAEPMQVLHFISREEKNARAVMNSGLHKIFVHRLKEDYRARCQPVSSSGLSIIANLAQWQQGYALRNEGLLPLLRFFSQPGKGRLGTCIQATVIVLFLGGRDETGEWHALVAQRGVVVLNLIEALGDTLSKTMRGNGLSYGSFLVSSLTGALRIMAIGEANKKILAEHAIPVLVAVLAAFVKKIPAAGCCGGGALDLLSAEFAVEALLEISFIAQTPEECISLMPKGLEELLAGFVEVSGPQATTDDDDARRSASSLIRRLQLETPVDASTGEGQTHVMISYCWATKDIAVALADSLTGMGILVWRDEVGNHLVPKMSGSTDEIMALAVEASSTVLILVSEEYKNSANCRMEASYANQLRKRGTLNIVYVMTQNHYTTVSSPKFVNGWLALMIGAELWYAAFDVSMVAQCLEGVAEQLKKSGTSGSATTTAGAVPPAKAPDPLTDMDLFEVQSFLNDTVSSSLLCALKTHEIDGLGVLGLSSLWKKDAFKCLALLHTAFALSLADSLQLAGVCWLKLSSTAQFDRLGPWLQSSSVEHDLASNTVAWEVLASLYLKDPFQCMQLLMTRKIAKPGELVHIAGVFAA